MKLTSTIVLLIVVIFFTCATEMSAPAPRIAKKPNQPITIPPPPPKAPPVSEAQAKYYSSGIKNVHRFVSKMIPKEMISSLDKGNDTYIQAQDASGNIIGYLRDFMGPVTLGEECPCDPINLTLIFKPNYMLDTIISPSPLKKLDGELMTIQDMSLLIRLAKYPPKELLSKPYEELQKCLFI